MTFNGVATSANNMQRMPSIEQIMLHQTLFLVIFSTPLCSKQIPRNFGFVTYIQPAVVTIATYLKV